jgi:hypothetical protein
VWLASSPEVEGKTGGYFYDCRSHRPSRICEDREAQARLWALSERLTKLAAG